MQDYIDFAKKNKVILKDKGMCQFCGANTKRGVHECLEIFNLDFHDIDFSNTENHIYRFLIVDAHALQHPEIHGRWSNHFHLLRLHLIFNYNIKWNYGLSPKLSDYLNKYKVHRKDEYLIIPKLLDRGTITAIDVLKRNNDIKETKTIIKKWALEVYNKWYINHTVVDVIAKGFLSLN